MRLPDNKAALLFDPDHSAAHRWGAYGPKVVAGEATTGPLRSTFVLDADGVVRSAEYELDPNDHASALLTELSQVGS
jgi:thioredoxin-dependent peroxiredoxin